MKMWVCNLALDAFPFSYTPECTRLRGYVSLYGRHVWSDGSDEPGSSLLSLFSVCWDLVVLMQESCTVLNSHLMKLCLCSTRKQTEGAIRTDRLINTVHCICVHVYIFLKGHNVSKHSERGTEKLSWSSDYSTARKHRRTCFYLYLS